MLYIVHLSGGHVNARLDACPSVAYRNASKEVKELRNEESELKKQLDAIRADQDKKFDVCCHCLTWVGEGWSVLTCPEQVRWLQDSTKIQLLKAEVKVRRVTTLQNLFRKYGAKRQSGTPFNGKWTICTSKSASSS